MNLTQSFLFPPWRLKMLQVVGVASEYDLVSQSALLQKTMQQYSQIVQQSLIAPLQLLAYGGPHWFQPPFSTERLEEKTAAMYSSAVRVGCGWMDDASSKKLPGEHFKGSKPRRLIFSEAQFLNHFKTLTQIYNCIIRQCHSELFLLLRLMST